MTRRDDETLPPIVVSELRPTRSEFFVQLIVLGLAMGGLFVGALPQLNAHLARQDAAQQEAFVAAPRGVDMAGMAR